jgi:hypothetical protein
LSCTRYFANDVHISFRANDANACMRRGGVRPDHNAESRVCRME